MVRVVKEIAAPVWHCAHLAVLFTGGQITCKIYFLSLQEHHEEDFFLYIAYSDEDVYGVWDPESGFIF